MATIKDIHGNIQTTSSNDVHSASLGMSLEQAIKNRQLPIPLETEEQIKSLHAAIQKILDEDGRIEDLSVEYTTDETGVPSVSADFANGKLSFTFKNLEGAAGKSAYDIAVDEGFVGTKEEWLASLHGEKGEKGDAGVDGKDGRDGMNGKDGDNNVLNSLSGDSTTDAPSVHAVNQALQKVSPNIVAGTNVTVTTLPDGRKQINANIPTGTAQAASQIAFTEADGVSTDLQSKVTELDNDINAVEHHVYGNSALTISNAAPGEQIVLESFGEMAIINGNQLLDNTRPKTWTSNGITVSLDEDGVFNLSGICTGTVAMELIALPCDEGNYTLSLDSVSNPNSLGWQTSVLIRKKNGVNNSDNKTSIVNNATMQYSIGADSIACMFGLYIITGQNVDGVKFRAMVNSGTTVLPYETYHKTISFPITSMTIGIGAETRQINISGGLKAYQIPVFSGTKGTGTTADTRWTARNEFTYADNKGNIYISDSVEVRANVLKVIRRVGELTYDSELTPPVQLLTATDGTPINYYSSSSNGLIDGATIYYQLAEPIEEYYGLWNVKITGELNITNSSESYMHLSYYRQNEKILRKFHVTELSSFATEDSNLWGIAFDGTYLYAGGVDYQYNDGRLPIYKFSVDDGILTLVKKVNLSSHNKVTCILTRGEYLYVISRSQSSATVVDNYGEAGNLFILDKNLELQNRISLIWKGCDAKVYKGYLYIMEQMGRFEVFSLESMTSPERVYAFDSAESKEILSDGTENTIAFSLREHQHLDCWSENDRDYMAVGGFEFGTHIYDISNPERPNRLGTFNMSFRSTDLAGMTQTFAVHAQYPLLYACCGMANASKRYAHNVPYGVITLPIDHTSSQNYSDLPAETDDYVLNNIPDIYKSSGRGEGDCHPSRMLINGDIMIVNCGHNLALYRIENGIPMFKQVYNLGSGSVDGFCAIDSNVIAIGSGMASAEKFVKLIKIE